MSEYTGPRCPKCNGTNVDKPIFAQWAHECLDCETYWDTKQKFSEGVVAILEDIRRLLVSKNERYGNSALDPIRVFSGADPIAQIKDRIDDKLSRVKYARINGVADDEDVVNDLIGYLVLYKLARERAHNDEADNGKRKTL